MPAAFREKSQKQILVVDDTPDNLRLLSAILTRKGYEVRKALDSRQATNSVKADVPDLILLDIKMPEVDGYEVCRALKQDFETCAIPIIFISALDDAMDKVKAFSIGGADYINKPFQEAEVLARIEHQLNLRDLQSQLEAQNQELAQSNQELEQFAHIVSHDLQQPLQSIMGYAKIIAMQYPDLLDTDANQYLKNILESGNRMRRLIQDLLNYAKADQLQEAFTPLDCNVIVATAVSDIDSLIKELGAVVTLTELPIILGNEMQLVQLFQNLLSNALKFARPDVRPEISIDACATEDDYWLLSCQDNGIGIPAKDMESIFQRFYRLHANHEYPGSGIGLATCKRIVENHNGTIWVKSKVGEGSSFYIKLPRV